jgi:transcriptional regulator with XRE-family HTH domain
MMDTVVALNGQQIRRLRILKGLTQRQLAEKAGMSQSTLALLERRNRVERFHPATLTKLAQGLEVEPIELVED